MKSREKEVNKDILDLTSITTSSASDSRYICKECVPEQILIPYPQAQIQNPYAGPSYRCPNCSNVYDSSLVKLSRVARKVRSTIGSERDSQMDFVIETVADENSGFSHEDQFEKHDPEPDEEEMIRGMGGTIIDSRIELMDSNGMNRTIVRRNSNNNNSY